MIENPWIHQGRAFERWEELERYLAAGERRAGEARDRELARQRANARPHADAGAD